MCSLVCMHSFVSQSSLGVSTCCPSPGPPPGSHTSRTGLSCLQSQEQCRETQGFCQVFQIYPLSESKVSSTLLTRTTIRKEPTGILLAFVSITRHLNSSEKIARKYTGLLSVLKYVIDVYLEYKPPHLHLAHTPRHTHTQRLCTPGNTCMFNLAPYNS